MKLKLIRKQYTEKSTIGELYIDGERFSYTLEDKVRGKDEAKMWGKTAIPAGTYTVVYSYSNRFKQLMPLISNVPGFAGIRVHSGSVAADTDGCVLLGYHTPQADFINGSRAACKDFYKLIAAASKKEKVTIEIVDTVH